MSQSPSALTAEEHFLAETGGFTLTVLHEHGDYRHIRFGRPGERWGSTDIHTWPEGVSTSGDMADGWTFERGLEFFRGKSPNLSYWSEKLTRIARGQHVEFSAVVLRETLAEQADIYEIPEYARDAFAGEMEDLVGSIQASYADARVAQERLAEFVFEYEDDSHDVDLRFSEPYEMDVEDYTFHYVWACLTLQTAANWLRDSDTRVIRAEVTS